MLQQQQYSAQSNDYNNTHENVAWNGRFHPVSQDFKFPSDNMSSIWNLWWYGKANERIAPYRKFQTFNIDNKNRQEE